MVKTGEDFCRAVYARIKKSPDVCYAGSEEYGGCSYSSGVCTDKSVGCLIGQVLAEFGFDVFQLRDGNGAGRINDLIKLYHEDTETKIDLLDPNSFTKVQRMWLGHIQIHQDQKVKWSEALRLANEGIGEHPHFLSESLVSEFLNSVSQV